MASARLSESVAPGDSASAVGSWQFLQEDPQVQAQGSATEVLMQFLEPKAPKQLPERRLEHPTTFPPVKMHVLCVDVLMF